MSFYFRRLHAAAADFEAFPFIFVKFIKNHSKNAWQKMNLRTKINKTQEIAMRLLKNANKNEWKKM